MPLTSSRLEADIAYFEARLSMLGEKPVTAHQHAQQRAYKALELILNSTLDRLTEQQRKRRQIKARAEVPLSEQVDKDDIQQMIEETSIANAATNKARIAAHKAEQEAQRLREAEEQAAEEASARAAEETAEEAELSEEELQQREAARIIIGLSEEMPLGRLLSTEQDLDDDHGKNYDSENVYLRNALFSERVSFLQDPEEVEDEWGVVGEAEIRENIGTLDVDSQVRTATESPAMPSSIPVPVVPLKPAANSHLKQEIAQENRTQGTKPPKDAGPGVDGTSDSFFNSWLND